MHVCIPVLQGFWLRKCLPDADQKWRIPLYCEFLTRLHLVKHYFYCILGVINYFNFVLIPHQVSSNYLYAPNVEPVHQLHKRIVCIYHHHIFLPLDPLVIHGCDDDFLESAVLVFD